MKGLKKQLLAGYEGWCTALAERVPAVVQGQDAEDIHRLRILLKRVRAALRMVRTLEKKRGKGGRTARELRDLAHVAGLLRDLQVQQARLAAFMTAEQHTCAAFRDLLTASEQDARVLWNEEATQLDPAFFLGLPERLRRALKPYSNAWLSRKYKLWRKRTGNGILKAIVSQPDAAAQHSIRKDVKRLLYLEEVLGDLLAGGHTGPWDTAALRDLETLLGDQRDLQQMQRSLTRFLEMPDYELLNTQAAYVRLQEYLMEELSRLNNRWHDFVDDALAWKDEEKSASKKKTAKKTAKSAPAEPETDADTDDPEIG